MSIPKAVWIAALNPDAKGPMAAKSLRTRDDMKRMAERLVAEGFHYVFPCVNYMEDQTQCQPLTGFDPLRKIVADLRGSAVKVHPWLCIAYQPSGTAHPLNQKGGGMQAMYNDHGTARPYSDHAICMARPEVQAFKLEMYRRLGAAYDLDGYHLDYIRWIEHGNDSDVTNHVEVFNACVCEHCRAQFRRLDGGGPAGGHKAPAAAGMAAVDALALRDHHAFRRGAARPAATVGPPRLGGCL